MSRANQRGQAILLVVVAMGIFLIGALGLAIDGSQLYGQRQMAQTAADAAAQAGILSIFNGTNVGTNLFGSTAHTCTTSDPITPCVHARRNGFGSTADDVVEIDFPSAATIGLDPASLSSSDPVNVLRVTITRTIETGLLRLLGGANSAAVKAVAAAAILQVNAPVPILVLHPSKAGSLAINGNVAVEICGGPSRSIQVNSANAASISVSGASSVINLSHAGPLDSGNCLTGTGADFGSFGTNPYPGTMSLGTKPGNYVWPASPVKDPLYFGSSTPPYVAQPTSTGLVAGTTTTISATDLVRYGCPAGESCTLYTPGLYSSGITVKNDFALFTPGLYYISSGGLHFEANSGGAMATGTGTPPSGFTANSGMMVVNSGNGSNDIIEFTSNAGTKVGGINLVGADAGLPYESILFFQSRTSSAHTHTLQGGGIVTLKGTMYFSNPWIPSHTDMSVFQTLQLQGNPGSTTTIIGQIITDALALGGSAGIKMQLDPSSTLIVRQIALVK
jgi:Flp pilus assembly protein TadG